MNNVQMYVFSGTGNSLLTAEYLKDALSSHSVSCSIREINDNTDTSMIDTSMTLAIGSSIACSSVYPVVWRFIERLPETKTGTKVFLFSTFAGHDGEVCSQLQPVLESKGYNVIGYEGFIMPNNFMAYKIDSEKNDKIIAVCKNRTKEYIDALIAEKPFKPSGKYTAWFFKLIFKSFMSSGLLQKAFKVKLDSEKCTGCGICVEACPVGNFKLEEGKAVQLGKCEDCMRCVGFCPVNALKVHKSLPYSCYSYKEFFSSFDR